MDASPPATNDPRAGENPGMPPAPPVGSGPPASPSPPSSPSPPPPPSPSSSPPPARLWTLLIMLVAAPLVYIAAAFVGFFAAMAWEAITTLSMPDPELVFDSAGGMAVMILFAHGSIFALAVAAALLSPRRWRDRLGFVRPAVSWWALVPIVIGTFAFGWLDVLVLGALFEAPSEGLDQLFEEMAVFTGPAVVLGILSIGVIAGTAEEAFFRGYLQTRLLRRWGPLVSITLVSVLFGAAHIDVQHALIAGLMGVWLGVVCWRTASLWPPIFCHVAFNSYAMIDFALMGPPEEMVTYAEILADWSALDAGGFAVCGAALLASIVILWRARPDKARLIG